MLYVDLPTTADLRDLATRRHEASVSLYLATTPQTQHIGEARTRLTQLLKEAEAQLEAAGTAKRTIWPISEQVNDLIDDDDFWHKQANGLAILVTPDRLLSFRLPTKLTDTVQVSDRFHLKPLMRVASFPQAAYVLALEENRVRLVEVSADLPPHEVKIPGMPRDAAAVAKTRTSTRAPPRAAFTATKARTCACASTSAAWTRRCAPSSRAARSR
jgi:hypothetical protein